MPEDFEDLEEEEEREEEREEQEFLQDDSQSLGSLLSSESKPKKKKLWIPMLIMLLVGIGIGGHLLFSYSKIFFKKEVGALSVYSKPAGAKIYLNGKEIGETPKNVGELAADEYTLNLILEGFEDYGELIKILPNQRTDVKAALVEKEIVVAAKPLVKPSAAFGKLKVTSKPEGAEILVDGSKKGVTPLTVSKLGVGSHKVQGNKTASLNAALSPLPGNILITSTPSSADVYLGGAYKGKTPITLKDLAAWKAYEIRVSLKNHRKWVSKIFTDPGETVHLKVALEPTAGTYLYITSIPYRANIYLGGKEIGQTPLRNIGVAEGSYRVKAVKAGFKAEEKEIMVRRGETTFVNFTLP